jgi:hypothetical protein
MTVRNIPAMRTLVAGGVIAVSGMQLFVLAGVGLLLLVLALGVVLPAVWSRSEPRRDAALGVLRQLLLRPPSGAPPGDDGGSAPRG